MLPFGALLRLAGRAIVGLAIVAVLVGRSTHRPATQHTPRCPTPPRYHAFGGHLFPFDPPHVTRLLDTETGAVTLLAIAGQAGFDPIGCSPWRDATGQYHLAGCRMDLGTGACGRGSGALEMARYTFPGGQTLDRIPIDLVPAAPPCWFPDRSDLILFAARDGHLYLLSFTGAEGPGDPAPRPRAIRWEADPPWTDSSSVRDPCWPSGPALGGRLLISHQREGDAAGSSGGRRLWWLQMSPDGTAVVAAGRLIVPSEEDPGATRPEERCPGVGIRRDGVPMLAYIGLPGRRAPGELWTAPIGFESDAAGVVPRVRARSASRLATTCVAAPPGFSSDGRWTYAAVRDEGSGQVRVERFAVPPDAPRPVPAAHSPSLDSAGGAARSVALADE